MGSSATRNSGLSASARAMPTRRACPPDSSCGYFCACSDDSSTISSSSSTSWRWSSGTSLMRYGSVSRYATRSRGLRLEYGSWKIICARRRRRRSSPRESSVIDWPSNTMLPLVAGSRPRIVRPSVVLPDPDSPTRPSTSPRRSSRSTPSTARTAFCPVVPVSRAQQAAPAAEVRREPLDAHQHLAGGPGRRGRLVGAHRGVRERGHGLGRRGIAGLRRAHDRLAAVRALGVVDVAHHARPVVEREIARDRPCGTRPGRAGSAGGTRSRRAAPTGSARGPGIVARRPPRSRADGTAASSACV